MVGGSGSVQGEVSYISWGFEAMIAGYRVVITSPPDREGVVAEIWQGDEMWAEIANEEGHLTIEVYPRQSGRTWMFDYEEALKAMQLARNKLLGNE